MRIPYYPGCAMKNIKNLAFEPPDPATFPCLKLAINTGKKGGTYPAVLCAADEVAVELFLSGRLRFTDIAGLVQQTLEEHQAIASPTLEAIMAADDWGRKKVSKLAEDYNK